jgi:hypothetical protein
MTKDLGCSGEAHEAYLADTADNDNLGERETLLI